MKSRNLGRLVFLLFFFCFSGGDGLAQDASHQAAMSALAGFFSDPAARADYAAKNPEAFRAEQNLLQFPPNIQKRLEKVVLMIMQESGANAAKHGEAVKSAGAESAFNSFSPAVQREIQDIARELERDPEFLRNAGLPK